jgi:8-oxo-dGTP diphosphatase
MPTPPTDQPLTEAAATVIPCAGALVFDANGRLLLVRRGRPPGQRLWSVPGGRVESGESVEQAVAREVTEETGLTVEVGRLLGTVHRAGPSGTTYEIADHLATVTGGELRAGDDATETGWFEPGELPRLPFVTGLLDALRGWGALDYTASSR